MGQSMQYIVSFADIIKKGKLSRQNRHHKKRSFGEIGDHKKVYADYAALKKSKQDQVLQEENGRKRQKMNVFERF